MTEVTLVCMVGGMSSRFGGRIKGFAKVGPDGEMLVECILNQALSAGVSRIVFVVSPDTQGPFTETFGSEYHGVPVAYALQAYDTSDRDRPWGTVDAVCSARDHVDGPFVVSNGDDICGERAFGLLVDHLQRSPRGATVGFPLAGMVPEEGTVTRGIFELNDDGTLRSATEMFGVSRDNLSEKGLTLESIVNVNLFAFQPEVIGLLDEVLTAFKAQHAGERKAECLLPTEIGNLVAASELVMDVYVSEERWIGITNPEDEDTARELLRRAAK